MSMSTTAAAAASTTTTYSANTNNIAAATPTTKPPNFYSLRSNFPRKYHVIRKVITSPPSNILLDKTPHHSKERLFENTT